MAKRLSEARQRRRLHWALGLTTAAAVALTTRHSSAWAGGAGRLAHPSQSSALQAAFAEQPPLAEQATESTGRREAVAFLGACAALLSLAGRARAAVSGRWHDQAAVASKALHSLLDRWEGVAANPEEGAQQVSQLLSGNIDDTLSFTVPANQSAGVSVEDRTITEVSRSDIGWQLGDVILSVDGVTVANEEALVEQTKAARAKGVPVVYTVKRSVPNPFTTIIGALTKIYADADTDLVLPEPDEVQVEFLDLKNKAGLAQSGIVEMSDVKAQLEKFSKQIDLFASA